MESEKKIETGQAVGEKDEGLYFSIDKRCTIYTAETAAIAKAIQKNE